MNGDKAEYSEITTEERLVFIIDELDEILHTMTEIPDIKENKELQPVYCNIVKIRDRVQKSLYLERCKDKMADIIHTCNEIEFQGVSCYQHIYNLTKLIHDYKKVKGLDTGETIATLIDDIHTISVDSYQLTAFQQTIDPSKVNDKLGALLIECFSLADYLNISVDQLIARKIKQNIQKGEETWSK